MSIVDQIKQEIFNFYCSDCKHFIKYLLSLTKSGRLVRLVTTNECIKLTNIYDKIDTLGSNLYIVVLINEGYVIIMSKYDIEQISGLNLWLNSTINTTTPINIKLNYYGASIQSPNIIVTDLPSQSIIYQKINTKSNKKVNYNFYNLLEDSNY
tara:strand:+ start:572 stop:1030 length:459 start_codon:yes stop_codon:yes gene_type:complete